VHRGKIGGGRSIQLPEEKLGPLVQEEGRRQIWRNSDNNGNTRIEPAGERTLVGKGAMDHRGEGGLIACLGGRASFEEEKKQKGRR